MNNSDEPATAISIGASEQAKALGYDNDTTYTGLTKREAFAMAAMQGLCANRYSGFNCDANIRNLARTSSAIADALLKELEK